MKAAVLYEQKKPLVVDDIEIEDPKKEEVLVKIAAAGVCHSDLHLIEGLWPAPLPLVMGHEGAGVVERIGPDVTMVEPGDHVILTWVASCGVCRQCSVGRPYLCNSGPRMVMKDGTTRFKKGEQRMFHQTGVSSFAEYSVVHQTACVKIRPDAPLDKCALIGCAVTTGVGAVFNTTRVRPGSSVVVFGCGGVGLNVVQAAAMVSASTIIAVDIFDNKLEMAKRLGATHTINASRDDPRETIMALVEGGVDYAFEVIGLPEVVVQAFESINAAGTAVMVGMPPLGSTVTINTLGLFVGKTLTGAPYGSSRPRVDMPMLVDLYMSGKLKLDELVSRSYSLEQINDAFDALKKGEVARSIIRF